MLRKSSYQVRLVGLARTSPEPVLLQVLYVIPHVHNEAVGAARIYLKEDRTQYVAYDLQADLSHTLGRLTELSMKPESLNWNLETIGATISTLVHGSYRFNSLSPVDAEGWFAAGSMDDLSGYTTNSCADQSRFAVPSVEGETYFAVPRFYPSAGLVDGARSERIWKTSSTRARDR